MTWLRLVLCDGVELRCRVASVRTGETGVRVALGPGVPRDKVARMKGAAVVVEPSERAALPEADYDTCELLQFEVLDDKGKCLGRIVEAYETGAHGVIEVEKPGGAIILLPAIEQVITDIDFERGVVHVGNIAPFVVESKSRDTHGDKQ